MKKIAGIGLLVLVLGCAKPDGYKVEVALQGASGKTFLEQREGGKMVVRDTTEFTDGKAVFTGKVEFPDMYYLRLENKQQRAAFFLENASIKISGHADSLQLIKVAGSPVNDEYFAFKNVIDQENRVAMEKYQEYREAEQKNDTVNAPRLLEEVKAMFDSIDKRVVDFVKGNPASWVTPYYMQQVQSGMNVEELDSLVNRLDPKLAVVPAVINMKERVEKLKKVADGQTAPDFTMNDTNGNPVKLSDVYVKNKYTLIDFWAAWCGPCRGENPNVVAVYTDYNAKGFSVLGVSLDQDRERWLKAIEDDKLTWLHVSDLKYWQNEAAGLYAVNAIPANFLVDNTGKIIAHNLRGEDLRKKIAELLP